MFWTTGLAIALANLPMAGAELKCGFATLQQGDLEMTVAAVQQDALPASVTRVQLQSFDAGHDFALGAVYSPEGMALGPPTELLATSLVAMASDAPGPVEQLLAFPEGAAKEAGVSVWIVHRRTPPATIASASISMGRAGTTIVDHANRGGAYRIERRDRDGKLLGAGTVRLPTDAVTSALFLKARTAAIAALEPCQLQMRLEPPPPMLPPAQRPK